MKKSIIQEVSNGKIGNLEQIKAPPEYFKILDDVIKYIDDLNAVLLPEQKEILQKLTDAIELKNAEYCSAVYAAAYKLGFLTGLEVSDLDDWNQS